MTQPPKHPLPYAISQKLDEARQVLRSYLTKKWLSMTVCWVLLVFWVGAAIDYLPVRVGSDETPRAVRIAFLAIMAAGALWLLFGWLLPRLLRRIENSSLALLVERQHPELGNRLITAVQVSNSDTDVSDPDAHAQMFERVLDEAASLMPAVNVEQLYRWQPLRYFQFGAYGGLLLTAIVAISSWAWFGQWTSRLFGLNDAPWPRSAVLRADWLQLPLPTFTGQLSAEQITLKFQEALVRIPSGSSPRLQVSADASAPRLPEICTLHYRAADGTRGRANLRRIGAPRDGWQQFHLDGPPLDTVAASMDIDIVGLDARLRNYRIEVIEPVVIVELQLECEYPDYLLDSLSTRPKRETVPYRTGMKIPEGTICTLIGRCSSDLSLVEFTELTTSTEPSTELAIKQAKIDGDEFRIALGEIAASKLVEIRPRDQHGLSAEQVLRYNIAVQPDTVPEVASRLEGIGLAITPVANLPIRGKVTDDHGIAQVAAEMSVNESLLPLIPLSLNDIQLSGEIDLQKMSSEGQLTLAPGVTIGLSIRGKDRYNLGGGEHIGRGQPQQLTVVTNDDLLKVLDRQELELRQRLEQIINELGQMRDVMESLVEQLTELETAWKQKASNSLATDIFVTTSTISNRGLVQDEIAADEKPKLDEAQEKKAAEDLAAQRQAIQRLSVLKAQQSQLQADKSRQELASIVNRVENLRLQLVNNRIDSVDRQLRLLEQVEKPLSALLAGEYAELDRQIARLQNAVTSGKGRESAELSAQSLEKIIATLEAIKASMLDIESFNEIVDLVRGLLDEQERLLKETEEAQSARVLEIFKQ